MVRKTHTKSRKGCSSCKRRHVKCDEKRPTCSACARLDIECEWSFGNPNGHASLGSPSSSANPSELALADLKLLHFWTMNTAITCCTKRHHDMWQNSVVELGFRHQFLLHGILAVAAIHKASIYPHESEELSKQSSAHMDFGISGLRSQLENPDASSVSQVFALSGLLVVHSLGVAQLSPPSDPIADLCHWMRLIKGVQATVAQHRMRIMTTEVADVITHIESVVDGDPAPCPVPEIQHLKELVNQVPMLEDSRRGIYLHAIDELNRVYGYVYKMAKEGDLMAIELTLTWIALIDPTVLDLISERDELALVILAHFAVLFHLHDHTWWTHGWARWTIDAARSHIGPPYLQWTEWSLAQLQSTPGT